MLRKTMALAAAVVAIVFFCAAYQIAVVPTPSMEGAVLVGDHLLVSRLGYSMKIPLVKRKSIERGEVISFHPPTKTDEIYLKRVIAVGGDVVEIRHGLVFVNGKAASEPDCRWEDTTLTVPKGELYVLGDNREHSEDSRYWGTVPEANVVGHAVAVLWSFAQPSERWLGSSQVAIYLDHPLEHLRWSRLFRFIQ